MSMSSFGEDLRLERTSRGIALEQITAVTKISQHHLLALEQDRFRQLPGGILSKGIVRGYAVRLSCCPRGQQRDSRLGSRGAKAHWPLMGSTHAAAHASITVTTSAAAR